MLPGFTPPAEAHSVPSNPSRALVFNVNGASRSSNNIRIDGVSTTNIWLPHVAAYVPALESLETVNVVTNSFDAEQGLAGGSAINVQIKSGTNNFHGSAFEYHTNEKLRTQQLLRARQDTPEGRLALQPVRRHAGRARSCATSCSTSAATRAPATSRTLTRTLSVPTAALRRGDLQRVDACPSTIRSPATANGIGPDRVCRQHHSRRTASIRPRAKLLALLPLPNLRTRRHDAETNNYFVAGAVHPEPLDARHQGELERHREAERLRPLQRARLLHRERHQLRQRAAGPAARQQQPGHAARATPTTSRAGAPTRCSPTLVMDAHFGFVRMNSGVAQTDIGENKGLDLLGPARHQRRRTSTKAARRCSISTPMPTSAPPTRSCRTTAATISIRRSSTSTGSKGRHNVRFGTDIYFQALNHTQPEISGGDSFGARGGFRFQAGPTQIAGRARAAICTTRSASFLLGAAEPGRPAEAGRAVHHAQLAIQLLRARSVAGRRRR